MKEIYHLFSKSLALGLATLAFHYTLKDKDDGYSLLEKITMIIVASVVFSLVNWIFDKI